MPERVPTLRALLMLAALIGVPLLLVACGGGGGGY
jgi:hypothetical protein